MASKRFPIEHVLTVYTGICMKAGVGVAQDVFDHLFPGIFTVSCGRMQPRAAKELERQYPRLAEIPKCQGGPEEADRFIRAARAIFGDAMAVEGPLAPSGGVVAEVEAIAESLRRRS